MLDIEGESENIDIKLYRYNCEILNCRMLNLIQIISLGYLPYLLTYPLTYYLLTA